ncbi:MAG: glycosyltransferase [Planctomycetes bacterium]|nr:glycosyltransferase [Planctomycetota bacterium]MCB9871360.1 glycosyltransferase [Planctomycetota bacterium]MCB9888614.1 glycosyltransferase [Planctomycetota bacterium]
MRVLMVTEAASAGVGRHVIDLCDGLVRSGDEVHLIHATGRSDPTFEEGIGRLGDGIRRRVIEMRRAPHAGDLSALRELRRYAEAHGPFDVVHGQSSKGGALVRLARRTSFGALVYTPHCVYTLNPMISRVKRLVYGSAERWLAKRTDAVIAVSPSEADHLRDFGFPDGALHCVPNGLGAMAWRPRAEARVALGLEDDQLVVGFLGRLTAQKDPLLLVEAFAQVASRHPRAVLAVAGTGELSSPARYRANMLGIADRIRWVGFQRPQEFLPACDLFVLSSRYEGMPYVYLEALACGLPIVSTAVGGSELAIVEGENGLVVPHGDVQALARALKVLLADGDKRAAFAAASLRRSAQFTLPSMVSATRRAYEGAVERRLSLVLRTT